MTSQICFPRVLLLLLTLTLSACPGATEEEATTRPGPSAGPSLGRDAATAWYEDADGDGYGTYFVAVSTTAPAGTAAVTGDCDDGDADRSPDAEETCDGLDDDCDGRVDEDLTLTDWYEDDDGDGYGSGLVGRSCEAPENSTELQGDCDDGDAYVYPDAPGEIVGDGVDTDCDGSDPVPFVNEDFLAGTPGTSLNGYGCFVCTSGTCDETLSAGKAVSGSMSLHTSGSTGANLYCSHGGFNQDFSYSTWFYDDGVSANELRVFFHSAPSSAGPSGVGIGYESTTCGYGHYCGISFIFKTGVVKEVDLGTRSAGWHEITATAVYSTPTSIDWEVCVNNATAEVGAADIDPSSAGTCETLTTTGYAIGTFRLHHDKADTYMDRFLAWNL